MILSTLFKKIFFLLAIGLACAYPPPPASFNRVEYGKASFYDIGLAGKKTASGEIYNPREMTAAHRTLPFGTWVRVTELSTKKSVVVRINDRGPFVQGRIIDLSNEAARRLGILNKGITDVKVEILKLPR